jgi:hypothetical protein
MSAMETTWHCDKKFHRATLVGEEMIYRKNDDQADVFLKLLFHGRRRT